MKLIENFEFERELGKLLFIDMDIDRSDELEALIEEGEFDLTFAQSFEDYSPANTHYLGNYSDEINESHIHSWLINSNYYVCKVPKEDIQKLQKKKFLLDLKDDEIYVLFEIGMDDSSMYFTRTILLIGQFNSKEEQAEKLLLKEFVSESLKREPPGKWRDFLKDLLD